MGARRELVDEPRHHFGTALAEHQNRHVDSCYLADLVANPAQGRTGRHKVDVVAEFLNLVAPALVSTPIPQNLLAKDRRIEHVPAIECCPRPGSFQ
jgi:hypothetical protein